MGAPQSSLKPHAANGGNAGVKVAIISKDFYAIIGAKEIAGFIEVSPLGYLKNGVVGRIAPERIPVCIGKDREVSVRERHCKTLLNEHFGALRQIKLYNMNCDWINK